MVICREERELTMTEVNSHNLFFLEFVHQLMFQRMITVLKLALSPSSGREAPNVVDPLDQAVLKSLGTIGQ